MRGMRGSLAPSAASSRRFGVPLLRRPHLALLLFALAMCGASCDRLRPTPEIVFTRAAVGLLRADDCHWVKLDDPERWGQMKPGGNAVECRLTQMRAEKTLYVSWEAYDDQGDKVDEGFASGMWMTADSRVVHFFVKASVKSRIARIEVDAG